MRKKILYIAEDGKEFVNKNDAINYENELKKKELNKKGIIILDSGVSLSRNDIIEYFSKLKCDNCPLGEECGKMYNRIRRATTDAFGLCEVMNFKY